MRVRALRGVREPGDAPRVEECRATAISSKGPGATRQDETRGGTGRAPPWRAAGAGASPCLSALRGWPHPCECACPSTPRQVGAKCAGTSTKPTKHPQTVPNPTPPCQTPVRGKTRLSAPASELRGDMRFPRVHWRTAEQTRSHGSM
jgi:hypothetical protein